MLKFKENHSYVIASDEKVIEKSFSDTLFHQVFIEIDPDTNEVSVDYHLLIMHDFHGRNRSLWRIREVHGRDYVVRPYTISHDLSNNKVLRWYPKGDYFHMITPVTDFMDEIEAVEEAQRQAQTALIERVIKHTTALSNLQKIINE